jgi:hypothetical protein
MHRNIQNHKAKSTKMYQNINAGLTGPATPVALQVSISPLMVTPKTATWVWKQT